MDESLDRDTLTSPEDYHPEDEYTPLDAPAGDTADSEAESEPAEAAEQKPDVTDIPAPSEPEPTDAEPAEVIMTEPEAPAESVSNAAAEQIPQSAFQQGTPYPQGAPYPPMPCYPYPMYGMPYPVQPDRAAQPPYYPGFYPPVMPCYPQAGAVPPYPAMQPYPAPAAPTPPAPAAPAVQAESPYRPGNQADPSVKKDEKGKKPTASLGTKVYLTVLTALMVAMVAGFCIYVAHVADRDKTSSVKTPDSGRSESEKTPDSGINYNSNSYEEFDEAITLVEDRGDTQRRDDDREDTVGTPDPNAPGITLHTLPADKDDAKYTTQTAYESVSDSVVTVKLYNGDITDESALVGQGTGTIISSDGYLITNAHVIKNSRLYAVKIVFNSGQSYQAKVIGYDTWSDLAVLKIDAVGLTPVVFGDSELIEIGQDVVAIGSPGGEKFKNTLTKGVVSAVGRELSINKYVRYIQSDAAISPGNSGGPLCNIYGQVIGINTAKSTATNYEAMTFSIPSSTVQEIVNDLLHYGYVRNRARIGFSGVQVDSETQLYYGVPAGIIVGDIDQSGALAGTGIRTNDIITAVDGKAVTSFQDIYAILNEHKAGDTVTLSIYRVKD